MGPVSCAGNQPGKEAGETRGLFVTNRRTRGNGASSIAPAALERGSLKLVGPIMKPNQPWKRSPDETEER